MKKSPQLLIVDDDEVLLIMLEKMIHKVNPLRNLTMFSWGRSALDCLEELKSDQNSRFLLLDINLKDMSAWEFLSELESRNDQYSKVIIITTSVSKHNQEIANKYSSVIAFFEKPITYDVVNQIEKIIESHTSRS